MSKITDKEELRKHIGTLIKNLTPLHELEYKVVFNLHENAFFQKLIPREVLERARVKPDDYFKALIFLDYFTRIVENDYSVCDNLENLSKAVRDGEREKGVDKGASYFNLETVVSEAALWKKEKQIKSKKAGVSKEEAREIKKRYEQEKQVDFNSPDLRKLDGFYEAIGEMACDQVSDDMKPFLEGIKGRADLGALVFTDVALKFIDDKKYSPMIYKKLENKDYLSASLIALKQIVDEASMSKLKSAVEKQND